MYTMEFHAKCFEANFVTLQEIAEAHASETIGQVGQVGIHIEISTI